MKNRLLEQAKREYPERNRFIALLLEAVLFLFLLPLALIYAGHGLDEWFHWPQIKLDPINLILGWSCILAGWLFAIWSIYAQFKIGRGTPVPLMATQKLVIQPPYSYCRNPMALGAIVMYLGVAIWVGSIGAVVLVLFGATVLLLYIRRIEEKEMELRFGQEYLTYKEHTPFLFPRFGKKGF